MDLTTPFNLIDSYFSLPFLMAVTLFLPKEKLVVLPVNYVTIDRLLLSITMKQ